MATKLFLDRRQLSDLYLLTQGALAPVSEFQGRESLEAVLDSLRLPDGRPWTIPILLVTERRLSPSLHAVPRVTLADHAGAAVGTLEVQEAYPLDKRRFASAVFGTTDDRHPGAAWVYSAGDLVLAGPASADPAWAARFGAQFGLPATPAETRARIAQKGWRTVVGFQTRNPIHRAHEFVIKTALETVDGLLLQPLVGETRSEDVPADVRLDCYRALLEHYFVAGRTLLAALPAWMRYAGPREAVFHALVRKNYGCTHFIVGRDHAGVGNYYGPFDAQHIFSKFSETELGIHPVFFDRVFYCRRCAGMATPKTCPHPPDWRLELSGSEVRQMLNRGQLPPPEFSRPEVAAILARHYAAARGAA